MKVMSANSSVCDNTIAWKLSRSPISALLIDNEA
jgi:hypothetical protein